MSFRERPIRHIGGRPCLDFVNTANWSPDGVLIEERLGSDADVAVWRRDAGLEDVAGQHGRLDGILAFRNAVNLNQQAPQPPSTPRIDRSRRGEAIRASSRHRS